MKAHQVAQLTRMGRGWAVTRNSATLAVTDYKHIGEEIVRALNKDLREALDACTTLLDIIKSNADLHTDPRMENMTDCYLVPLDDIEAINGILRQAIAASQPR